MAKKSKKQKTNGKLFLAIALLFGIASIFMILLPAIKVIDNDTAYTGLQVVFGHDEKKETLFGSTITTPILEFSFMNLLAYILVIVGVITLILNLIGKANGLLSLISIIALVGAGVLFFLTANFTMPVVGDISSFLGATVEEIRTYYQLGIGAILGGIFSILAGVSQLVKNFVK